MNTATLLTAERLLEMPLAVGAELDSGELLPGFRYPIAGIFINHRGPESSTVPPEFRIG